MRGVYALDVSLFFMHPFDKDGKAIFYQWAYNTFLLASAQQAKDSGWRVLGCAEDKSIFKEFVSFYGGYDLTLGLKMLNVDLFFDQNTVFEDGFILRSDLEADSKIVETWLISAYQGLDREVSYPDYKNYLQAYFESDGQLLDEPVNVGGPGLGEDKIFYISPVAPVHWTFSTIETMLVDNFGSTIDA